jgi:hypothetical protein
VDAREPLDMPGQARADQNRMHGANREQSAVPASAIPAWPLRGHHMHGMLPKASACLRLSNRALAAQIDEM